MNLGSCLHERPIEKVSVVGDKDSGLSFLNMLEKPTEALFLVWFIKDGKQALVFRLGGIFKVFNVLRDNLLVRNQEALWFAMEGENDVGKQKKRLVYISRNSMVYHS